MASRGLRAQLTQLQPREPVQRVPGSPLRMLMASPEERRVNDALGALAFLGGGTGGGTPETGGAALGAIPTGAGMLGEVGGGGVNPDGSFEAPSVGGDHIRDLFGVREPDARPGAGGPPPGAQDAGDASDVGAGSVAGGSTADVSPQDVASFGKLSLGPLSTNPLSLGSKMAGLFGSPLAAAILGIPGMAMSGFQSIVGLGGMLADAFGIPTANALAQQGHPAGLAATGQLAGLGISPEGVFSDPEGLTGVPGGYSAVLGPNSPLGPQGSYVSLDPSNSPLGGLSQGGVPGSPSLADLGLNTGQPAPGPTAPLGPLGVDPLGETGGETAGTPDGGGLGAGIGSGAGTGEASVAEHRGGVIEDRYPGREEPRRLLEQEFVVRPGPSKKYRPLLEAINQNRPPRQISRLAQALCA